MTRSASLRAVLVTALARQGVDASALPIAISDDPVGRVWNAFRAFAAEPVQDLYPDLTIPGPGRSDTDRLGFEFTPGRPATRNSGPRPPSAWLVREVYLVDANGDSASNSSEAGHRSALTASATRFKAGYRKLWGLDG
jgi:hypothetical protein